LEKVMTIGVALVLIAIGAIMRFAVATAVTHGFYVHTIGDILMGVGVLGLILWLAIWGPVARGRRGSQLPPSADGTLPGGAYTPDERRYEDHYPR
jgi:hypothetical protein